MKKKNLKVFRICLSVFLLALVYVNSSFALFNVYEGKWTKEEIRESKAKKSGNDVNPKKNSTTQNSYNVNNYRNEIIAPKADDYTYFNDNDKVITGEDKGVISNGYNGSGVVSVQRKLAVVVGDSYANCFRDFEGETNYLYKRFFFGGIDNESNQKEMWAALDEPVDYILFSTGINDQANETELAVFENVLLAYAKEAANKQKVIFVHSYMDYPISGQFTFKYKVSDYDNILKNLPFKYSNVVYINMKDYEKKELMQADGLHYNKVFYDVLRQRMEFYIRKLDQMFAMQKNK